MIRGLLGKKIGMTQIFDRDGNIVPVTIVEVGPCRVLGLMDTPSKRVKIGYDPLRESRLNKPQVGFFKKIGVTPMRYIREIESTDNANYQIGQELKADVFKAGDFVNVAGISIGKGFQGGMKRWHWRGGPAAHGSMHHRRVGSVSSSSDPSRVYKGKTMPGHMGDSSVLIENLRVLKVDVDNNLILVNGSVPGKKNAFLTITISKKKPFQSLEEKKVVRMVKRNPMKQSRATAAGKAK